VVLAPASRSPETPSAQRPSEPPDPSAANPPEPASTAVGTRTGEVEAAGRGGRVVGGGLAAGALLVITTGGVFGADDVLEDDELEDDELEDDELEDDELEDDELLVDGVLEDDELLVDGVLVAVSLGDELDECELDECELDEEVHGQGDGGGVLGQVVLGDAELVSLGYELVSLGYELVSPAGTTSSWPGAVAAEYAGVVAASSPVQE
jgi:hypothetical protein